MPNMDEILKKKALQGKTTPPPPARMNQLSDRLGNMGFAKPVAPLTEVPPGIPIPEPAAPTSAPTAASTSSTTPAPEIPATAEISLTDVQEGKFNPRMIYDVPLSWIDYDDKELTYNREEVEGVDLSDLETDMKEKGQIEPGFVRLNPKGLLQIIQGWRRALTAQKLNLPAYRCVITRLTDQEAAILSLSLNLNRKDIPDYQKIQKIIQFSEKYNLTQEEIGQQTGFGKKSFISQVMNIRLFPTVMEALKTKKLTLSEAAKVAMKSKKDNLPEKKIEKLIDLVHKKTVSAHDLAYLDIEKHKKDAPEAPETLIKTKTGGFRFRYSYEPEKAGIRELEKTLKAVDEIRATLWKALKDKRK